MSDSPTFDSLKAESQPELYPHAKEVGDRAMVVVALSLLMGLSPQATLSAVFTLLREMRSDGKYYGDSSAELATIAVTLMGGFDDAEA